MWMQVKETKIKPQNSNFATSDTKKHVTETQGGRWIIVRVYDQEVLYQSQ